MAGATWKSLFETGQPGGRAIAVRVFLRGGHPLLIVPFDQRIPRGSALALYAAQTLPARLAKMLWRWSLTLGVAPGSYRDSVQIDAQSPFVRFLSSIAGGSAHRPAGEIPAFVILAGNPHAPAPRFLVQLFDSTGIPVAVVKAGIGKAAAALIGREADFLQTPIENQRLAMPKVRGRFAQDSITAFSMPFVEGISPRAADFKGLPPILNSWVHRSRVVSMSELAAWGRLKQTASQDPQFGSVEGRLSGLKVHPALFHGDLAPWNIKISAPNGGWTVLDWERAETEGPPCWDWFHYVIQTAMLADKKSGSDLLHTVTEMLSSAEFKQYATGTGVVGHERDLLAAYAFHCRYVLKPEQEPPGLSDLISNLVIS